MMECMKSMAKKPQTNADRIRSMTDEELAGLLKEVKEDYQWASTDYPDCEDGGEWLNWLQLEAEQERAWKIDIYTEVKEH